MAFSIDREDTYHILFWLHRLNTQFGHGLFKRERLSYDDCHDDDDGINDGDDYVFLVIMVIIMMQPPLWDHMLVNENTGGGSDKHLIQKIAKAAFKIFSSYIWSEEQKKLML